MLLRSEIGRIAKSFQDKPNSDRLAVILNLSSKKEANFIDIVERILLSSYFAKETGKYPCKKQLILAGGECLHIAQDCNKRQNKRHC